MPTCAEDTGPMTGPITGRGWLFCRFMQHGCDWPGARPYPSLEHMAEEVRATHEQFCRFRFLANL